MLFYTTFIKPIANYAGFEPESFSFENKQIPLSTLPAVFAALVVYYSIVHLAPRPKKAMQLKYLFFAHNALLSFVSFILLGAIGENLFSRVMDNGLLWGICSSDAYEADHRIEFFFYVNYLIKYYELLDTVFMILKGKKVEFLHWYHHSMTMVLCYVQLAGRTSATWIPVTLNLTVHVIMYYYYARTSVSSKKIWWKKYLTTMQIIQFVIDLVVINFGLYLGIIYRHGDLIKEKTGIQFYGVSWGFLGKGRLNKINYDEMAGCHGDMVAGTFAWCLIMSYLLLFIQFFKQSYQRPSSVSGTPSKKKMK